MIHLQTKDINLDKPTAVTIGNFDGLHKGHRRLVENIVGYGGRHGLKSLVLSFEPHPKEFFGDTEHKHIVTRKEKLQMMERMGVDYFVEYPFDLEFASCSPYEFLEILLKCGLNAKYITVGENYKFGKNGEGDVSLLQDFGEKNDIEINIERLLYEQGRLVCSTNIKNLIETGEVYLANWMLGYNFFYQGIVETGRHLGNTIGFPTANLGDDGYKVIPKIGVYVTNTEVRGQNYLSVTNVGDNPTVNGKRITIETNIKGFDADIYGESIKVQFLQRIRDQRKFASLDELKVQIDKDSEYARRWARWV